LVLCNGNVKYVFDFFMMLEFLYQIFAKVFDFPICLNLSLLYLIFQKYLLGIYHHLFLHPNKRLIEKNWEIWYLWELDFFSWIIENEMM